MGGGESKDDSDSDRPEPYASNTFSSHHETLLFGHNKSSGRESEKRSWSGVPSHNVSRNMSDSGRTHLKQFEGFRSTTYKDNGGHPTIASGHNQDAHKDWDKFENRSVTREEGEQILKKDLAPFEKFIGKEVPHVNQNQYDTLVSFAFNFSKVVTEKSTLLKEVKAKNDQAAAKDFGKWFYCTLPDEEKVISKGLVNRRAQEKELFLKK